MITLAKRRVLRLLVLAGVGVSLASCSLGGGIAVRGVESAFENMPGKLAAGEHVFQFTNRGKEPHEMVVVGLREGSASIRDVLRLPEQEATSRLNIVGRSVADPGQEGPSLKAQLKAGNYALVCFLPVGGSGPPHFSRGMVQEFTVA